MKKITFGLLLKLKITNAMKYILKLQVFIDLTLLKLHLIKFLTQEEKVFNMSLNHLINNSLKLNLNNREFR